MSSKDEWWSIINQYNACIYPVQIVVALILLAALIITACIRNSWRFRLLYSLTGLSFLWLSIGFFLLYGKGITGSSYGDYFFSTWFFVLSLLFLFKAFRKKDYPDNICIYNKFTMFMVFFLYPLTGILLKRSVFDIAFAGTMPCPTVALACILVSLEKRKFNLTDLLLLFWAVPMTPFLQIARYGIYEDAVMFLSGIFLIFMRIIQKRKGLLK